MWNLLSKEKKYAPIVACSCFKTLCLAMLLITAGCTPIRRDVNITGGEDVWRYSHKDLVSNLRITTRPGAYYFIKLFDIHSEKLEVEAFLHGDRETTIEMPEGSYRLIYTVSEDPEGWNAILRDPQITYIDYPRRFHFYKLTHVGTYSGSRVRLFEDSPMFDIIPN